MGRPGGPAILVYPEFDGRHAVQPGILCASPVSAGLGRAFMRSSLVLGRGCGTEDAYLYFLLFRLGGMVRLEQTELCQRHGALYGIVGHSVLVSGRLASGLPSSRLAAGRVD